MGESLTLAIAWQGKAWDVDSYCVIYKLVCFTLWRLSTPKVTIVLIRLLPLSMMFGKYGLFENFYSCYIFGATRGVMVSMSTFLPCHQCYCAGLSLAWGLNLQAVVCGIFWSSLPGVFSGHSGFLPSFISLMIQPTKKAQINVISPLSNLIAELSLRTKWHVAWHLHMISARCVIRYLHTIAPGPLVRVCWRQFAALWGYCKKSRIAPLSAIFFFFF